MILIQECFSAQEVPTNASVRGLKSMQRARSGKYIRLCTDFWSDDKAIADKKYPIYWKDILLYGWALMIQPLPQSKIFF